ncbi:TonB-dependent receptor [Aquimarina sp. ERC-38]|uniref:TonB-dependent receptor n=1 Tax=Aquimarina sp. ERC-38 TaxID=2949996 RepID=UPI002247F2EA|nr:TonB-dependent receptor [Aquimarina sp. ERC-38]UZO82163.1 TonB-dependent receptor [Aquimarina sp. ERC-38]
MKNFIPLFFLFLSLTISAQITFTGQVIDDRGMPIPLANISLENEDIGTVTDFDGMFTLTIYKEFPITIIASSVGYESNKTTITENSSDVQIILREGSELDIVVISASRSPERIFESPVSIEAFGVQDINATTSSNFYTGLGEIKGVDVNRNSLTFNSINTRGFASFTNTRFVQLIDGMDNTSPSLNFVVGNLIGINELDVENIELLPGASSALYGANAFNGILFINSKNPFDNEGISTYVKSGATTQEAAGTNLFYDVGFRAAKAFSDKFAVKVNFSLLNGTDWFATDFSDELTPLGQSVSNRLTNPAYDGLNIYGDEVVQNIRTVGQSLLNLGKITQEQFDLLPVNQSVSRTGYKEEFLTDYNAQSLKADFGLYYRPATDDFEISFIGRLGQGQTIFQDTNRFSLNDFLLQQYKLEVKNKNFFVRGYITAENAGDTYDIRFAGINVNRAWKSDQEWFGQYVGALGQTLESGADLERAFTLARGIADTGRFLPGSAEFEQAFDQVIASPDLLNGAQLISKTRLFHSDANYNFSHLTSNFADIQVGGSFRQYTLDSDGKVFTDINDPITYSEFGLYSQIQRKLIDDRLKLTGSIRYDKSELFEGNFSPRFSIGYTLGEKRNRNLRFSVQTGFRNPTTQDLYLGLNTGQAIVLGSAEDNLARDLRSFTDRNNMPVSIAGTQAYQNSFLASSVLEFAASGGDANFLTVANPEIVKPEKVTSFELGYRAKFGSVILDLSGYYNEYQDFISTENVIVPFAGDNTNFSLEPVDSSAPAYDPANPATIGGLNADTQQILGSLATGDFQVYQAITNSEVDINSYGVVFGLTTKIFGNYDLGGSYTYAEQDFDKTKEPDFETGFNTPQHKIKASFGNQNLFENFGFNTNVLWSDEFLWESSFADGIVPSYVIFDAQVNYRIPSLKSTIKLGGTNIGGSEYAIAPGTGLIGSQYYLGVTFNNF